MAAAHVQYPLHSASKSGDVNKVRELLTGSRYDVNCTDSTGLTPLYYACGYGHLDMIKVLMTEFQADITRGINGFTAVMHAVVTGHENVVDALLCELQCPVDTRDHDGNTVLHYACLSGNVSLVRALIHKHKADVKASNNDNCTPLDMAALKSKEIVVQCLIIEFGCDVNVRGCRGRSLLHHACQQGDVSLVQTLIRKHKADINAQDNDNNTPLYMATSLGEVPVARHLINEFGCDPNVRNNFGRSLLHAACEGGDVSLVRTLIHTHKADINARDSNNDTPLNVAAFTGRVEVALCLIDEFGCDPNVRGNVGRSLLHNACQGGNVSLVRTLVHKHKADVNANDNQNNTPIKVAAATGKVDVTLCLINELGGDPNVKNYLSRSLLHDACKGGDVSLVRILIHIYKADINALDNQNDTPLNVAASSGRVEVALCLINEFCWDPNVRNILGRSMLHHACQGGSISLVQTLIREYKVDVNARDNTNKTPLNVAVFSGKTEVALLLINEFSCDPNVRGNFGRTLLHIACEEGNISLVRTLIHKHKADVNAHDNNKNTPLNVAAFSGEVEVALCLINDFGCDLNNLDRSILHDACQGGSIHLIRTLIYKHKADVNARDGSDNTPLHVAAFTGKIEVALCLINEFGCDYNVTGDYGRSLLHHACIGGNVSLVRALIHEYKADINAQDHGNSTPLIIAVLNGKVEVTLCLINEFGCNPNIIDDIGRSLLHYACEAGNITLVRILIHEHNADVNALDDKGYTPLHVALNDDHLEIALYLKDYTSSERGNCGNVGMVQLFEHDRVATTATSHINEPALSLIKQFACDSTTRAKLGRSLLLNACQTDNFCLVKLLLWYLSPLLMDGEGNTPLHISSQYGNVECVKALLFVNAPIRISNFHGLKPMDVATSEVKLLLQQHMETNLCIDYDGYLKHVNEKYSGEHSITHVFILGNSGAGKSSLIESFKRSFLPTFERVSESSVSLHTAGIVPSVHMNKQYGRVVFHDFAGDSEYYSSHAAILENIASLKIGDNMFIIVVDLRDDDDTIERTLHYWVTFIQHQNFTGSRLSLIIVGSHSDLAAAELPDILSAFSETSKVRLAIQQVACFMLDCCDPRSNQFDEFRRHIMSWTRQSLKYSLYPELGLLLGLLEKDFSEVITCPVQEILSHIKDTKMCLPTDAKGLYPIILGLREAGFLLLVGDPSKDDYHVVLNISKLTNEVHKLLFSKSAFSKLTKKYTQAQRTSLNIGIIPQKFLLEVLPPYITKECLIQLQYCQKINSEDFELSDSSNQKFLFFPALCTSDKCDVSWVTPSEFSYSIGWLTQCSDSWDYFPPRFLHVLLLRLVFRFSVPSQQKLDQSPDHRYFHCRCTMWKRGVHWLTEGVECMVELVNGNKGVAVITKSKEGRAEKCATVFCEVINCVMEARAEFCHSIKPDFFLLNSTDDNDYLSEDNQFDMHDVELALSCPKENEVIVSITGKRQMECTKLLCMRKLTHWNILFPLDFDTVLHYLKDIVKELYDLGDGLGISRGILEALEVDFPTDCKRRRRELVREWMSSSLDPPCWWHLVQALKKIDYNVLAEEIENEYSTHIRLQDKLLDKTQVNIKPAEEFLELFAGVVGSKWPSLVAALSLNESDMEEVKGVEELSKQQQALQMLKKWVSRDNATYGQLCLTLKTISLFHYSCN